MSCCEWWVSLLSMVFWLLIIFFALLYMNHVRASPLVRPVPASAEGNATETERRLQNDGITMDWFAVLAQGWLLMFMAVFGVYLSLREMMMEVNHRMALLGLEIITFMHYLTAGSLVATGPWADDEGPDENMFLTSFAQMMLIVAVALGLVHVGMACERKALREKQAKINAALR